MQEGEIQVFKVTGNEYWAGRTAQECEDAFLKKYGEECRTKIEYPITACCPKELRKLSVHSLAGKQSAVTFKEHLERLVKLRQKFPCKFALFERKKTDLLQ